MEERSAANSSLVKYMNNPRAFVLKKWFIELLQERYTKHDQIVERVALGLPTEEDVKQFGALVAEVFEAGYFRAVSDYKKQAEEMGLKVKIVTPEPKKL